MVATSASGSSQSVAASASAATGVPGASSVGAQASTAGAGPAAGAPSRGGVALALAAAAAAGRAPAAAAAEREQRERAMKMSKVGNQTNSQDPQAVNSRVFVGNLNTFQCSKTDVERMFQRYGRIAGISMHKGYAFVQFTNPFDARSACLGEDGRTVLGQVLDVNMVAEPKPHQTGRKRQNVAKTGNDWDYYYDSYYASASFPPGPPRLVPPLKRPRLMAPPARPVIKTAAPPQKPAQPAAIAQLKTYSNPDILICGNCREMFTELQELLDHKKTYCKLRFTCKCHTLNGVKSKPGGAGEDLASAALLLCVLCKDSFCSAWDLMVHVQAAHMMNIYELGVPRAKEQANAHRLSPELTDNKEDMKGDAQCSPALDDDEDSEDEDGCDAEGGAGVDALMPASPASGAAASPAAPAAAAGAGAVIVKEEPNGVVDIGHATANGGSPPPTHDKELAELLAVESTAQACIMHALHIERGAASEDNSSPAPLVVPLTNGELSAQE